MIVDAVATLSAEGLSIRGDGFLVVAEPLCPAAEVWKALIGALDRAYPSWSRVEIKAPGEVWKWLAERSDA